MAFYKLSKTKIFHVHYCGCTAASFLLNEQTIRDAINFIRQVKTKQDFVRTILSTSTDGIKLTYENEQKFSTLVPAPMIAGSAIGKSSLHDTVGVVYISPLTSDHYPAFIHIYRCDSARTAEKLLSRLRSYLLIESHRLRLVQLEQALLDRNLLNFSSFNPTPNEEPVPTPVVPPPSEQKFDPIKSVTEEFQRKIQSNEPILFPPKDYDTLHANHGNIQRAQAWKSTEPAIVGYSPINVDENRLRQQMPTQSSNVNHHDRLRLTSQRSDTTADPVETVSLAFDFLKDETGSIFTDHDAQMEELQTPKKHESPIYRFRPAQATAISNNWLARNNPTPQKEFPAYHNNQHRPVPQENRARSETRLIENYQPGRNLNERYGSRLLNGNAAPISTNPVWSGQTPMMAGSQPNLLLPDSPIRSHRMGSGAVQHSLYASHPNEKSNGMKISPNANQGKRQGPTQILANRKQIAQSQYFDTNEFILRASDDRPLKSAAHPSRYMSGAIKDKRPHSMNINGNNGPMLDVYY